MLQEFEAENPSIDGVVTGGSARAKGLEVSWQDGPLEDGMASKANGCFVETLLQVVEGRLSAFQASDFACPENERALIAIGSALKALGGREDRRKAEGTLGTRRLLGFSPIGTRGRGVVRSGRPAAVAAC
ncbi:MAG: hypothetical protein GY719_08040 [bacterium]|nr:hypothetical protein [bacterium]